MITWTADASAASVAFAGGLSGGLLTEIVTPSTPWTKPTWPATA